jgi:putative transposase
MPRQPRIDLPHIAQHVVQRGNDRRPCFFQGVDYLRYLSELREPATRSGCAIHAYVPMANLVHLLLTPSRAGQISAVMKALGRRYVRYVNDRYHRTGTLWEGRYKACPVDTDSYLPHCYRYIKLNPVRAGMVSVPGDYRWSSYHANASGQANALLTPHSTYLALGLDGAYRQHAYARLVAEILNPGEVALIRLRLQRQHALGTDRFRAMIEAQLQRRAGPARIGRPSKAR